MSATANQQIPFPALTDPADGPGSGANIGFQDMAEALERLVVMRFIDAADRTARLPDPVEGMLSYLTASNRLDLYTGTAWAQMWPPTMQSITDGTNSTSTNSLTYVNDSIAAAGIVFVAPLSGAVLCSSHFKLQMDEVQNLSGHVAQIVREGGVVGSGTAVFDPGGTTAAGGDEAWQQPQPNIVLGAGTGAFSGSLIAGVTGLTPGSTYNYHLKHACDPGVNSLIIVRRNTVILQ